MGNPHIKDARVHLTLADESTNDEADGMHTARAAIHAQLAIAYELNTIGRLLAITGEIIQPIEGASADYPAGVQHNAILERLGL